MDPQKKEQKTTNGVRGQPVPTVGTTSKEGGVRANVEASEQLPVVKEELKGYIKTEEPQVPHEPQAGITASLESTPVLQTPTAASLPMTEDEADAVLKESKSSFHLEEHVGSQAGIYTEDAKPFLATLIRKFFQSLKIFKRKTA